MIKRTVKFLMVCLVLTILVIPFARLDPARASPVADLVGRWHFDEGIGSTAYDSSGNGNDGTLAGGKFGNALRFDGVDDYVEVLDSASLDITGDITLEAWILINDFSTSEGYHMYIVSKDSAGQRSYGIGVDLTWIHPKRPFVIVFHPGGSYKVAWGTTDLNEDVWYHIAGSFDVTNDKLTLYVNGSPQPQVTDTSTVYAGSANLRIGAREYAGHRCFFNGLIDEVRISSIARTTFDLESAPAVDGHTVALWHFDESVDAMAYDETTNANDGTIHGAKWAGPTWTTGFYGDALCFDGLDDYVDLGANTFSDSDLAVYTFEAWVKISALDGVQRRIFDDEGGLRPMLTSSNKLQAFHWDSTAWTGKTVTWSTTPTVGQWYHVVQTYDGTHAKFYIDGTLVGSVAASAWEPDDLGRGVRIGSKWSLGNYWKGIIDEVRLWSRTLSAEEIKRHAWGLVGEWLFDEGGGTTAYDTSGFANHGTISGAGWTTGKYDTALDFNGMSDYVSIPSSSSLEDVTETITVEAWVNLAVVPTTHYHTIARKGPWLGEMAWGLDVKPEGKVRFFIYDEGTAYVAVGSTILTQGKWYHIAGTYDGGTVKVWINGVLDGTTVPHPGDIDPSTDEMLIGKHNGGGYLDGIIDEVRVWNQALVPLTFKQTGLESTAEGKLVVTVTDPIPLNYEDLPYILMVPTGTSVSYDYEETIVISDYEGFTLTGVTGPESPITISGPTEVTGNYLKQLIELCFDSSSDSIVAMNEPAKLKACLKINSEPAASESVAFSSDPSLTIAPSPSTTGPDGCAPTDATGSLAEIYTITATYLTEFDTTVSAYWTLVVFDPNGMAAGGGWYVPLSDNEISMGGRANFGFIAKYIKGQAKGNLEFQYQLGDINLKSTSITWLVVSNTNAHFKGQATMNRIPGYYFRVLAHDGGEPSADRDTFDIKIWDGDPDDPTTNLVHSSHNTLSGGNIQVRVK